MRGNLAVMNVIKLSGKIVTGATGKINRYRVCRTRKQEHKSAPQERHQQQGAYEWYESVAGGMAWQQCYECVKWFACPHSTHSKLTTDSHQTLTPTIAYITLVLLISVLTKCYPFGFITIVVANKGLEGM